MPACYAYSTNNDAFKETPAVCSIDTTEILHTLTTASQSKTISSFRYDNRIAIDNPSGMYAAFLMLALFEFQPFLPKPPEFQQFLYM